MILAVNSINQLIFVTLKCNVFFAEGNEFLNIIYTSFGFKVFVKLVNNNLQMAVQRNNPGLI
jgi:hypothetical protein